MDVSSTTFGFNTALNSGGAIYIACHNDMIAVVYQDNFTKNSAKNGGAIFVYAEEGTLVVKEPILTNNHASISGGAIYFAGGLTLDTSSFSDNAAGVDGLAIGSSSCGSSWVDLHGVYFSDNGLYCPAGQYQPYNQVDDPPIFHKVCNRCSCVPNSIPGGVVDGSTWLLPVCRDPPRGTLAPLNGTTIKTLTLEEGYYRESAFSEIVIKCYRRDACVGGDDPSNYCDSGYTDAHCFTCRRGYYRGTGYKCIGCSHNESIWSLFGVYAVGVSVPLAVFYLLMHLGRVVDVDSTGRPTPPQGFVERKIHWFKVMMTRALPLASIKIVVAVWQILFQFSAVAQDVFPEEYEKFLSYVSYVDFDIGVIVSYSCLISTNFHDRLVVTTTTPMVVLTLLALGYYVAKRRYDTSPQCVITVRRRHLYAALLVVFLVYSSVSSTIFQTFVCEASFTGVRWLKADPSILCDSDRHLKFMIYAGVMTIVYPIGIPVLFCCWLLRNRKYLKTSNRDTIVHLQPFSGVWSTYNPSRYYFEVVEYCRRLTLSISSVFLVPNSVDHIAIVFSLAVVFLFVSESLSPFQRRVDMSLYRWGNGIVLASMYIALLMKAKESEGEFRAFSVFGWLLITANIVMIVVVVIEALVLGGVFRDFLPRVEQIASPVRRQTKVHFQSVKSIHPSPTLNDGSGETKDCELSRGDDGKLPDDGKKR